MHRLGQAEKLLGTRGVEEEGRGLLYVMACLRSVVYRELGEEPRPEAPGPRPELARVRDHETVRVLARLVEATFFLSNWVTY